MSDIKVIGTKPEIEANNHICLDVTNNTNVVEVSQTTGVDICSNKNQVIELFDPLVSREGNPNNPFINADIPNAINGLVAVEGFFYIKLNWIKPTALNHSYVEIYRAEINDINAAVLVGSSKCSTYVDQVCPSKEYYYWVRAVTYSNTRGEWNSVNGLKAKGGKDKLCFSQSILGLLGMEHLSVELQEVLNHYASILTELGIELDDVKAAITLEATVRADQYASLAELITTVEARLSNDINARFSEEILTRSNQYESLAQQITTLTSEFNTAISSVNSAITNESIVRSSATGSLANQISTLSTSFASLESSTEALITEERTTRSTETYALAQQLSTLSADFTSKDAEVRGLITTEQTVRASEVGALAQSVTNISTTVGDQTASISQIAQSVDGVKAKWGVQIDNNGVVTGVELNSGDSEYSSFKVRADKFELRDTSGNIIIGATGIPYSAISGTKPPANATANKIYRQSNTPSGVDGDIWIYTGVTPNITRIRVSGAWQDAANYVTSTADIIDGAGLGTKATWNNVTGTGKPENGATKNTITSSTSAPNSTFGSNGDIHVQTVSNAPNVEWIKISGSWTKAATVNEKISPTNIASYIMPSSISSTYIESITADQITTGLLNVDDVGIKGIEFYSQEWGYLKTPFLLSNKSSNNQVGLHVKKSVNSSNRGSAIYGESLASAYAGAGVVGTNYNASATEFSWGTVGWHFSTTNRSVGTGGYTNSTGNESAGGDFSAPLGGIGLRVPSGRVELGQATSNEGAEIHMRPAPGGQPWIIDVNGFHEFRILRDASPFPGITLDTTGKLTATNGFSPFTGSHLAYVDSEFNADLGDIVEDTDDIYKLDISNAISRVEVATTANSKKAIGVVASELKEIPIPYEAFEDEVDLVLGKGKTTVQREEGKIVGFGLLNPVVVQMIKDTGAKQLDVNSVGEGLINVCGQNGDIEIGDLIVTSDMKGKGMKQTDDIIRNYTVAKSRERVSFKSPSEVKQIACIYLCG